MQRHDITLLGAIKYFVSTLICVPILAVLSTSFLNLAHDTYYRAIPVSWVYSYDKIVPAQDEYEWGEEEIQMESYSEYFVDGVRMHWDDELNCRMLYGKWIKIAVQPWDRVKNKSDNTIVPERWPFKVKLPNRNTTCRVESSINATVHGIPKQPQVIIGEEFNLVRPKQGRATSNEGV